MTARKYAFSWSLLGDINEARPNLGPTLRIEPYRLMQFTFRDILEERYGSEVCDKIFFDAGFMAGKAFYDNAVDPKPDNFGDLARQLQELLKVLGVGILRVEKIEEDDSCVLTVSEDLDCSGLPDLGYETCIYDEGFLAGIFTAFFGRPFTAKEVDCWCTADRTCRFEVKPE